MNKELLKKIFKTVAKGFLGFATLDGWLTTKRAYYEAHYTDLAMKEGMAKQEVAEKGVIQAERAMDHLQQNLFASNDRLKTATDVVNENSENNSRIANELADPKLLPQKKVELTSHLNYYQECYRSAIIKQKAANKEIADLSGYNDPDILKSDFSELFNHLTDFIN